MSTSYGRGGIQLRWIPIVIGIIAAGFIVVKGCQEGPFGRKQVVALNAQQEAQLGAQAYDDFLRKATVIPSGPAVDKMREIGKRLADAAESQEALKALKLKRQNFDWEFRLVKSNQVNAFCLPGGKVVVYTGLYPVAQTEGGLAAVMGHEIGHALAHHGAERMAQKKLLEIGQQSAAFSLENMDPNHRNAVLQALNAGSEYGVLLPYSRGHESEADHIGILLMAAAGYDPRESIDFWKRMEEKSSSKSKTPEFQSTHPSHEHRAQHLEGWLKEALPLYQNSKVQKSDRRLPRP